MKSSQRLAGGLAIAIAVLAGFSSGLLGRAHDALANVPQSVTITAHACGRDRWNVKTLTDPAAAQVDLTPIPSTVEALRALPVPGVIEFGTPRLSPEMHTYTLTAQLLWDKLEADSDFHVVIAGQSGGTMIAEIADPGCAPGSAVGTTLARVRQEFVARFGEPSPERFERVRGTPTVRITGVLFFDALHSQRGVAPNGVELHPVLGL
jgi:hypothetical protein